MGDGICEIAIDGLPPVARQAPPRIDPVNQLDEDGQMVAIPEEAYTIKRWQVFCIIFVILGAFGGVVYFIVLPIKSYKPPSVLKPEPGDPSRPFTDPTPEIHKEKPWEQQRLPNYLQPYEYRLTLRLDVTKATYSGSIVINLRCYHPTEYIILDIQDVHISDNLVSVIDLSTGRIQPVSDTFQVSDRRTRYIISVAEKLRVGSIYRANITTFTGRVNAEPPGLYTARHRTRRSGDRRMVVSGLKPTGARHVFPCMDDPAMKATFDVIIEHPSDQIALTSSPSESTTTLANGWIRETFYRTSKLSTHLLGFALFEGLTELERYSSRGQVVRVWSPFDPNTSPAAEVALNTTLDAISNMKDLLGLDYLLQKTDVLPVPGQIVPYDVYSGLLMVRDTLLFCDVDDSSIRDQLQCAMALNHAVAHYWFGITVTAAWWSDLWVTEALSTELAYESLACHFPELSMEPIQLVESVLPAFLYDGHSETRSLNSEAWTDEILDGSQKIVMSGKGLTILKMVRSIVYDSSYMRAKKTILASYDTINTSQLWNTLSQATDSFVNVSVVMNNWVSNAGYPYVTLRQTVENNGARRLYIIQDAFSYFLASKSTLHWNIPVAYKTRDQSDARVLWLNVSIENIYDDSSKGEWVLGKADSNGFYRVNYGPGNWKLLADQLLTNHTVFDVSTRASLIDDAFNLARASRLLIPTALDLTRYLDKEDDYVPWKAALRALHYLLTVMSKSPSYNSLKAYISSKVVVAMRRYKIQEDVIRRRLLHSELFEAACRYGDANATKIATVLFQKWRTRRQRIDPDIRQSVLQQGIASGGQGEWNFVWRKYNSSSTTSPQNRELFLTVLASSQQDFILYRYLGWIKDGFNIRREDVPLVFQSMADTVAGRELAWKFVYGNWRELQQRFADTPSIQEEILRSVSSQMTSEYELQQLRQLKELIDIPRLRRILERAEEQTDLHIQWLAGNEKYVSDWLDKTDV
ncbi:thyrotropin-releasing hormone-degrading ectoenzyme-like isoform X2 [Branchiostoma floridae x Branchiostoma belcheri]